MANRPDRAAIIAAVVAAFRLGDEQETALAEAIYAAAVASAQAAFDDAVASLDIDTDATLPDDVLSDLASNAQESAASIVTTYNADLEVAAEGVADDALEHTLARELRVWANDRAEWKAAQIAITEASRGYESGMEWFVSDLLAGELELPDDVALSDMVITVNPSDAAEPTCAALVAGSPYALDQSSEILGVFPAHPSCIHWTSVDFAS